MEFVNALAGLSPEAQVILAGALFVLIVTVVNSRSATHNMCDCIDAVARLLRGNRRRRRRRRPPQEPTLNDAA
jgi:hypothetical protein